MQIKDDLIAKYNRGGVYYNEWKIHLPEEEEQSQKIEDILDGYDLFDDIEDIYNEDVADW